MNPKGITACLICFNEMFWLPLTLPGMLQHSDQLVVVDGSPDGQSTDGTLKFVEEHLRPQDELILGVQCSWETENNWDVAMRNAYLPYVKYSHVLMIDADEAYNDIDWQKLHVVLYLMADREVDFLMTTKIHFYKDLHHRIVTGPFAALTHNFWTYDPGARYLDISTIPYMTDGRPLTHHNGAHRSDIHQYHYGHASPAQLYRFRRAKFKMRLDGGEWSREQTDKWLADWKDDRSLNAPGVEQCFEDHPLKGVDLEARWLQHEAVRSYR